MQLQLDCKVNTMLEDHIDILLEQCIHFSAFFGGLSPEEVASFRERALAIEKSSRNKGERLMREHRAACVALRSAAVMVPSIAYKYASMPNDWRAYIKSEERKQKVFTKSKKTLVAWARSLPKSVHMTRVYGGLKPLASLDAKLGRTKTSGDAVDRRTFDTRDVVRFRVVFSDPCSLVLGAVFFWRKFFEQILYCHNYYWDVKENGRKSPYKGVHFQTAVSAQYPVEIQFITDARDIAGFFDYPFSFKQLASLKDDVHRVWLDAFRMKANIRDLSLMIDRNEREDFSKFMFGQ